MTATIIAGAPTKNGILSDSEVRVRIRQTEDKANRVLASIAGDSVAMGELLSEHRKALLTCAAIRMSPKLRRRVGPNDIVQTTFMDAYRCIASFGGETEQEFYAWLRGILINNICTAARRHVSTAKRSTDREVGINDLGVDRSWVDGIASDAQDPCRLAIRKESAKAALKLLEELSVDQAEAVRLRYLDGLGWRSIAMRMNRSEKAVSGLLKRGMRNLRKIVDEELNPCG